MLIPLLQVQHQHGGGPVAQQAEDQGLPAHHHGKGEGRVTRHTLRTRDLAQRQVNPPYLFYRIPFITFIVLLFLHF